MFTFITAVLLVLLSITMPGGVTSPSILMGVGIAIDVTLATIAKFRDDDLDYVNWTIPIMITHISFPAMGYYGFWGLAQAFPALNVILGSTGFILVVLFLYEVFCEWIDTEPLFGISEFVGSIFGFEEGDARRVVAIMAVSWDALWSGPAKAAQAIEGGWTDSQVFWSFIIAGLVVALVAQLALLLAYRMRKRKFENARSMARWSNVGKYAETTVIGGFGVLSLFQALNYNGNLWQAILIAGLVMFVFFWIFWKSIAATGLAEAEEAIRGEAEPT